MWDREVGEKGGRAGSGWVRCRRAVEITLCIGRGMYTGRRQQAVYA